MSKYIIEVGDAYTKHICGKGDMLCLPVRINEFEDNWLNTNIPLTPYTEPDTSETYQQGYEEGYAVGEAKKNNVEDEAYKRGAEDMRKALRLLIDCDDDCLTIPDIFKAFGEGSYHAVVRKHPAMEIIEKILAYEQKQEEIQVGDEVEANSQHDNKAFVIYPNEDGTQAGVIQKDGNFAWWSKSAFSKTGRTFHEIAAVLEKMRGEKDG